MCVYLRRTEACGEESLKREKKMSFFFFDYFLIEEDISIPSLFKREFRDFIEELEEARSFFLNERMKKTFHRDIRLKTKALFCLLFSSSFSFTASVTMAMTMMMILLSLSLLRRRRRRLIKRERRKLRFVC